MFSGCVDRASCTPHCANTQTHKQHNLHIKTSLRKVPSVDINNLILWKGCRHNQIWHKQRRVHPPNTERDMMATMKCDTTWDAYFPKYFHGKLFSIISRQKLVKDQELNQEINLQIQINLSSIYLCLDWTWLQLLTPETTAMGIPRKDTLQVYIWTFWTRQTKGTQWMGVRTDAGEWERLHTLHSGGCGFEGALLPV